jgi:hypothetical protein
MARNSERLEWLSLIDVSGPFLAGTVLEDAFPQGLEKVETPRRQRLRAAYEEWRDAVDNADPQLDELHDAWIRMVLQELLEYEDEVLVGPGSLNGKVTYLAPEHGTEISPDFAVQAGDGKYRLLVANYPPDTDLEKPLPTEQWPASPSERMTLLCRANDVRVGLISNGEQWMLINAPIGNTSGYTTWLARLWSQEPSTLKAFQSLLGVRRAFGPPEDSLEQLLERSLEFQEEVTNTLGEQVRRAVEVLIQALGRADEDRNGELLRDVEPRELYEAGLTVMMRLVFILCAEERRLLLLGDAEYDQHYAISTLRGQLREDADQHGVEVLERRHDAWSRMLSVFRAVYGGVEHEALRLPPLGGSLFDPDRFPFLEGRPKGTSWRNTAATPLPIDNRTVLLLLRALQVLEQKGGAQILSYRALDVEQIGHVYEGLLEYSVAKMLDTTVAIIGSQKIPSPSVSLNELEAFDAQDVDSVAEQLAQITGRSASAITNSIARHGNDDDLLELIQACDGDESLARRLLPYSKLIRSDSWGSLLVYRAGSFAVTTGMGRRETGTHYTPRDLAQSIVEHTLEPLIYVGPSQGATPQDWKLRSPADLLNLKICDPAMGSGAFLVQACSYVATRLVEAWAQAENGGSFVSTDGKVYQPSSERERLPSDVRERLLAARRLVAERCLYGVDMNPLAVELAKLSIWLVTLSKGRPLDFLDHNLRPGDSLLGVGRSGEFTGMKSATGAQSRQTEMYGKKATVAIKAALELRSKLREVSLRDIRDVESMSRLDSKARSELALPLLIADGLSGALLASQGKAKALASLLRTITVEADLCLGGDHESCQSITTRARESLNIDLRASSQERTPFHWSLEFPEVFNQEEAGFDAVVGNPPFMGGQKITGNLGTAYRGYLVSHIAKGQKGSSDLCAYFFLRAASLVRPDGHLGLLATNTIAQGDTREVGLKQLEQSEFTIYRAVSSERWPGSASIEIAHVWLRRSEWNGPFILDGELVNGISTYLTACDERQGDPCRLKSNEDIAFQGSNILGMGFLLTPDEAQRLVATDVSSGDVLFPCINGKDLNSRPDQSASRWAISFRGWPLERKDLDGTWAVASERQRKRWLQTGFVPLDYPEPVAADYPDGLEIVRQKVKPGRLENKYSKSARDKWWLYERWRPELYSAIEGMDNVICIAATSKTIAFVICQANQVFTHATYVLALDSHEDFAVLQSTVYHVFALQHAGSLKGDFRFSPSDCFETFPFPAEKEALRNVGRRYHEFRRELMESHGIGLTNAYNRFHCKENEDLDIQQLRDLHVEMDRALLETYGWGDIVLDHGFFETQQGKRFTFSESSRQEIISRLVRLNHKRFAEEEAQEPIS